MIDGQTYYQTLGVLPDTEDIVIRAAYRALAQKYHPDKWQGDPSEANRLMRQLNEAYETLSNPVKRSVYDSRLRESRKSVSGHEDSASSSESKKDMRPNAKQETSVRQKHFIEEGVWSLFVVVLLSSLTFYLIALGVGSNINSESANKNLSKSQRESPASRVIVDNSCRLLWTGDKFIRVTLATFPANELRSISVREGVMVYYERYILRDNDMLPIIKESRIEISALCQSGLKQ